MNVINNDTSLHHLYESPNPIEREMMIDSSPLFSSTAVTAPQFPPERLQGTLNILCDVAVGEQCGKRVGGFQKLHVQEKRLKIGKKTSSSETDTTMLLERLRALGGGFPMPRFTGVVRTEETARRSDIEQQLQLLSNSKIGSFPMPPAKNQKVNLEPTSLYSFRLLWENTRPEFREEILSRRLERGDVEICKYLK